MSFPEKPVVHELPDGGKYWTHYDQDFAVLVYVPVGDPRLLAGGDALPHGDVFAQLFSV